MPQQQLDDALEQLVTAELIFRRGIPRSADYTFKHALVQDAAYSTLLELVGCKFMAGLWQALRRNFLRS